MHTLGELNPADKATRKCRPKVLPQLSFHGPESLKSPNGPVFETVKASILPEVRIEELRTKLIVNAFSVAKSNKCGNGKVVEWKRFSNLKKLLIASALVLRFTRNMKCSLT